MIVRLWPNQGYDGTKWWWDYDRRRTQPAGCELGPSLGRQQSCPRAKTSGRGPITGFFLSSVLKFGILLHLGFNSEHNPFPLRCLQWSPIANKQASDSLWHFCDVTNTPSRVYPTLCYILNDLPVHLTAQAEISLNLSSYESYKMYKYERGGPGV